MSIAIASMSADMLQAGRRNLWQLPHRASSSNFGVSRVFFEPKWRACARAGGEHDIFSSVRSRASG